MGVFIGNKRYGFCTGKGNSNFLKEVTLEESYSSDNAGLHWAEFLELPLLNDTSDMNLYLIVFEGNEATLIYRTDFELIFRNGDGTITGYDVRSNRTNVSNLQGRTSHVSAGTVIKVYKIEQQ